MKNTILIILTVFLTVFTLTGCSNKKEELKIEPAVIQLEEKEASTIEENRLEKVSFSQIDGFFEDDLNHALDIFKKDCKKSKRFEEFKNVCAKAEHVNDGRMFFVTNFQAYKQIGRASCRERV